MLFINKSTKGIIFKVFVQPNSSKNMIAGLYGDTIKIKLTAPPVNGAANKMCIKYLANVLKIPQSKFEIISGHTSRIKHLLVKYKDNKHSKAEFEYLTGLIKSLL
ncbi:MAG: YggU family protein [Proteobacteria bacterium]|nr:YggU family protein [Pseudomonadota bacterium]MBU4463126.1 YggU family protein [Pseudomonadota bacterium]